MTSTGQTAAARTAPVVATVNEFARRDDEGRMAVVRIPPELSSDPRVRYDAAASRLILPISGLVGLLYLVLALLHPVMVGGNDGWILSAVAGISAVGLLGLAWSYRRPRVRNGSAVLSLAFLVMIANSGLHLWLTGQEWQTSNLMLVVIGAGMAILANRWNVGLTVLTWLAWTLGMLTIPGANWSHWLIAMGMATLVGQLVRYGRRGNLATAADAVNLQIGLLTDAEELADGRQALLATISHDVRTPVTGIVGMVDLLLQRPLDARTRELVSGVQHSADGLTTMLNNLLDLARVEAGRLEVHKNDADICEMVNEVLQMVGPIAQRKQIPLIGASSPDLDPWVNTDTSRFKQILLNLVSNAVKFTDEGAVTVVSQPLVAAGRPWVEVLVTDTGPGMSPEEQSRAFDMFVQGGGNTHRRHGGSGLGLAIAQRLTTALGGSLQIKSELGEGTVFRIQLPVGEISSDHLNPNVRIPGEAVVSGHPVAVRAVSMALQRFGKQVVPECTGKPGTLHIRVVSDTGSAQANRAIHDGHRLIVLGPTVTVAAAPTAGEYLPLPWTEKRLMEVLGGEIPTSLAREVLALPAGLRVLLAEDDTTNRNLITEMLRRLGATVNAVSDGAAAVEEIARDRYDIVLLDLNMPVMDGLEAVRVTRERLADVDSLAVVALTADPGWTDRSVLAAAGFNGYVLKPTTMADLHVGISKVLERVPVAEGIPAPRQPVVDASLDRETIAQLVEDLGDSGLVAAAVTIFLEELPERLVAIHRACGEGAADDVKSVAHSLKGSAAMLGALRLSSLCAEMETSTSESVLSELTAEAEQVETLMRDYLVEDAVAG